MIVNPSTDQPTQLTATGANAITSAIIHIQRMRRSHIGEVMDIDAECYPTPWQQDIYEAELRNSNNRYYLIARAAPTPHSNTHSSALHSAGSRSSKVTSGKTHKRSKNIVGYAGVAFETTTAHITTLTVAPRWQNHGVGTRLLLALLIATRPRNAGVTLEVGINNPAAQALYRRFGLAPVGIRKGYYKEMGFTEAGLSPDAMVMRADNIQQPDYAKRLTSIAQQLAPDQTTELDLK
ncbi:MAG: GNAT family N-acetyltransferase [bacterium]|nr:GNAT family N-acetyltransferase [bacterium]